MFVNTQLGGTDVGSPDTLVTPVGVPTPVADTSTGTMGVPAVYNVLFVCAPVHNMATTIPLTTDPPVGVGAASGTAMGPSRHLTGSFTFLVGGMPVTRVTSMSLQNSTNCPGMRAAPSQTKIVSLAP